MLCGSALEGLENVIFDIDSSLA